MSSEATPQSDFDLNDELGALDVVLDSLNQLATSATTERDKFYAAISQQIAASTESRAAAVFVKNTKGQARILHQHRWKELPPEIASGLDLKIKQQIQGLPQTLADPASEVRVAGRHKLIFSACQPKSGMQFLYALVRDADENQLAEQVFRDLALEVARCIEVFENSKKATQTPRTLVQLNQLAHMVQNLGKSGSSQELAFHLVNDLAKITLADRVTFFNPRGFIEAISGVSKVSRKTAIAKTLSKLARISSRAGSIEWSGEQIDCDGPRMPRGTRKLVESIPAQAGMAIPVADKGSVSGVLLFEFFETTETNSLQQRELINEAVDFATPVIARCQRTNAIPGIGLLDWFFNKLVVRSVRTALTLAFVAALTLAACYWLFAMQRPFEIYGEGTLVPIEKSHVFAHVEGTVESLWVEEGSQVEQQSRLLLIRSKDLENQLTSISGRIDETQTELRTLSVSEFDDSQANSVQDEARRASEIERLKIRLTTLQAQLKFYQHQTKQLDIRSPLTGQVTTQNLKQKLADRPVDRGDLLMTISNTDGEWELELNIPDSRIEFIKQRLAEDPATPLTVHFRLATDSTQTFTGHLESIDFRSDTRPFEEETSVTAHVSIDESELGPSLRIGSRVYGKVACGERSNFFLLTYEATNRINRWLFR